MGFPIATTVSAVSAGLSAVAAVGAWVAAHRANGASRRANNTADVLAKIERDRRHAELQPIVEIDAARYGVLRLKFVGPDELEPHGPLRVTVAIRDDRDRSEDPTLGDGPSREAVAAQVWGPWHLAPRTDGADQAGRTAADRKVALGEGLLSTIERTPAPRWYAGGQASWDQAYDDEPIRLRITVTCEGFEPWVLLREHTVTWT